MTLDATLAENMEMFFVSNAGLLHYRNVNEPENKPKMPNNYNFSSELSEDDKLIVFNESISRSATYVMEYINSLYIDVSKMVKTEELKYDIIRIIKGSDEIRMIGAKGLYCVLKLKGLSSNNVYYGNSSYGALSKELEEIVKYCDSVLCPGFDLSSKGVIRLLFGSNELRGNDFLINCSENPNQVYEQVNAFVKDVLRQLNKEHGASIKKGVNAGFDLFINKEIIRMKSNMESLYLQTILSKIIFNYMQIESENNNFSHENETFYGIIKSLQQELNKSESKDDFDEQRISKQTAQDFIKESVNGAWGEDVKQVV
ncbi:MAG: hypothetical protein JW791_00365, partial [Nanoarchaeota archaeon]|nr:hypothetical protein [Nanoarchaeota archaeon]